MGERLMFEIRMVGPEKRAEAVTLVRNVYTKFVASNYTDQSRRKFEKQLLDEAYLSSLQVHAAYVDNRMTGVIATKNNGQEIVLFYIEERYQRKGIGKQLIQSVMRKTTSNKIAADAPPCAVEAFLHMGFEPYGEAKDIDGVSYISLQREVLQNTAPYIKKETAKYRNISRFTLVVTVVFLALAIMTRIIASLETFDFSPVTAEVISAKSTATGKSIKVVVDYNGKEYTVQNVRNIYAFPLGAEVTVYLYSGQIYADRESIRSDSTMSKMAIALSVLTFISAAVTVSLSISYASSKKKGKGSAGSNE